MGEHRTIKIFCPSLSKLIQLTAWEEHKLDVGAIARAFGLDPSTVKLNGHFISRGADLVSKSVTWRALLKFFSAKGLSTGRDDKDALIVDGKFCRVGTKRGNDSQDASRGILLGSIAPNNISISQIQPTEAKDIDLLRNKKLKDGISGCKEDFPGSIKNSIRFKRKHLLEDLCLLKKLRINENKSDVPVIDDKSTSTSQRTEFRRRCSNENLKRPRDNEMITPVPCKRIR